MSRTKIKQLITAASASVVLALGLAGGIATANANNNPHNDETSKVTICHGTNAVNNRYESKTVDADAADGNTGNDNGQGDHSTHTGPVASSEAVAQTLKDSKTAWGDIIPPHDNYVGLNWTAEGQAVYNNGSCNGVYTPPTGGSGGDETSNNPQVLSENTAQVKTTPSGSVAAGEGGVKQLSPVAVAGFTGSLAVVVAGAAFAVKRFVRL